MAKFPEFSVSCSIAAIIFAMSGNVLAQNEPVQAMEEMIVSGGAVKYPGDARMVKLDDAKPAELPVIVDSDFETKDQQKN